MVDSTFLILDGKGMVALRANRPKLEPGQLAVLLVIEVPDSAFEESFPTVNVSIEERHLIQPDVVADVLPAEGLGGK